ncbi:transmembrane protein 182 [Echinops telfairi]|uniref:Transmembrane protein 182 n=1 Tax=Echinops telfairi TaxID=9371 RepID=A0AC55CHW0_ECHTE|nr:transmembrane protein 182 [Echinops telfairi]
MKLNIAIFFGALFGALGVFLFLVAFGSDYWLLATEVGRCSGEHNIENATFHHEGFFWRCWFNGIVVENDSHIWKFWYTNQPQSKNCTHAYLSPYPFMRGEHNSTSYDSALSNIITSASSLEFYNSSKIDCPSSYTHLTQVKYAFAARNNALDGILFSLVVVLYVIWVQAVADMESYTDMKLKSCLDFTPSVLYGWSFFLAPAGIFFALLAGLLFLVVGHHIQTHH